MTYKPKSPTAHRYIRVAIEESKIKENYMLHVPHTNPFVRSHNRRTRTTAVFFYYVQLCGTFLGKHYFQLLAPTDIQK